MSAFLATDHGAAARVQQRAMFPVAWRYVVQRYGLRPGPLSAAGELWSALSTGSSPSATAGTTWSGSGFTVADLTAAALLYPLVWPPEFQYELPDMPRSEALESVGDHPALGWISETWRRHRGRSAAI